MKNLGDSYSQEDLVKVQKAEQEINQGTDSSKILIAYDKKNNGL